MASNFLNIRSPKRLLVSGCAVLALASASVAPQIAIAQQQGSGAGKQGQGAQSGGNVENGQGAGAGGGSQGLSGIFRSLPSEGSGTSIETQVFRGKGERVIIIIEEDDGEDSDRPDFAGVPGGQGRPGDEKGSGGNQEPGTVKGDDYGDLIVLLRDPITGVPIVTDGEFSFLDEVSGEYVSMEDGEVPEGYDPVEVDFGRASVARSPDTVTDKALTEALSSLSEAVSIDTDAAGRIEYTVEGVTSTIDSPLENLALYIELSQALATPSIQEEIETVLGALATSETAASLFAAVADKTGDITLDYLVYQNVITGVVEPGDFYDYSTFSYDREYPNDYSYFYLDTDNTVVASQVDINEYLEAMNGDLPADGGAALFTAASDDALEVIELLHTQVHPGILPGDIIVN